MPKCPKCNAEIKELAVFQEEWTLHVDERGNRLYGLPRKKSKRETFCCPKCYAIFYTDVNEATKFLMQEFKP